MQIELEFLATDTEKNEICRDYWQLERDGFSMSIKEVASKHDLKSTGLASRISDWCQAYSPNDVCSQCHQSSRVYRNRSEYSQRVANPTPWICHDCETENIREEKHKQEILLRQVKNYFASQEHGVIRLAEEDGFEVNSLEQTVALLSLIRMAADEQLRFLQPLLVAKKEDRLSPTDEYDTELIKLLANGGVLIPNVEQSGRDAFAFENRIFEGSYYLYYVAWNLPHIASGQEHVDSNAAIFLVQEIERIFRDMSWPNAWNQEWMPLWRRVALEECLQYLNLCMTRHGFEFRIGQKTRQTIENALMSFSVAQLHNFIWGAARDAAAYYMRERISKKQAANSVVGSIQRRADRARAEGWDVKAFGRDRQCPQTMISQVLFNTVLQIGDEGFTGVPGEA